MSASPPSSPPRRPLHERSNSQNNAKLHQIRVVPYSPPRPSDEGSPSASAPGASPDDGSSKSSSSRQGDASPTLSRAKGRASVSGPGLRRASIATSSASNETLTADHNAPHTPSPALRSSGRRKTISVNSDKTFTIVPLRATPSRTDSLTSPPSLTSTSGSFARLSSALSDIEPSATLTPLTERSTASPSPSPAQTPTPRRQSNPESSSPWNYRMVGGVRKVAQALDAKQRHRDVSISSSERSLPPLPEIASPTQAPDPTPGPSSAPVPGPAPAPFLRPLVTKTPSQSSLSSQSHSAISEKTNYKVYAQSSPVAVADLSSLPPSSSHSNYRIIGESSSSDPSVHDHTRPPTGDSNANYVVHGGQSGASSIVTRNRSQSDYSQDSLVIAPLRPVKRRSLEQLGVPKSRSRDSLRRGSLSSISNVLTHETARTLFASSATIFQQGSLGRQDAAGAASAAGPSRVQMLPSHSHQWSSQLSTVMSESEGGSDTASRSLSPTMGPDRRSSGFNSSHSRHVLSISSSLLGLDELVGTPAHSRSGSLDQAQATYSRAVSRDPHGGIRLVRDHDEDGDGLADLQDSHHRPSRSRLGSLLSSHSSDRNLRSSASSRSRANSLNSVSIPAWARLYYGSGERRYLAAQASSDSMFSDYYNDSRPGSSFMSRTPSNDRYNVDVISPRRRPRDPAFQHGRAGSNTASMEITALPSHPVAAVVRNLKQQTSSIWSPHLGRDRRVTGYSIWQPPTATWSTDKGLAGRRNAQITLFVVGFIFPISWFVAAFCPLPRDNPLDAAERGQEKTEPDSSHGAKRQGGRGDQDMLQNIKWWRAINRLMSALGLVVLGAVVALVVVGLRQRWGS